MGEPQVTGLENGLVTAQQDKQIRRLQLLLEEAQRYVTLVALDWFVYGEKYQECFYCGTDDEEYHTEDCPVLGAAKLRSEIERMLVKR